MRSPWHLLPCWTRCPWPCTRWRTVPLPGSQSFRSAALSPARTPASCTRGSSRTWTTRSRSSRRLRRSTRKARFTQPRVVVYFENSGFAFLNPNGKKRQTTSILEFKTSKILRNVLCKHNIKIYFCYLNCRSIARTRAILYFYLSREKGVNNTVPIRNFETRWYIYGKEKNT